MWEDKPFNQGAAWVDMLLMANHKDKKIMFDKRPLIVKSGTFITSSRKLSDKWGWSRGKVDRFLKTLQDEEMIIVDVNTKRTAITIVNYRVYQDSQTTDSTTDSTTDEPLTEPLTDTNKNDKNVKNEKNEKKNIYGTFDNVKLTDDEYSKLQQRFPDYQDRIDNLSEYMSSKHKRYSSHYATILNWSRRDNKQSKPQTSAYMEAIKNRVDVVDSWV